MSKTVDVVMIGGPAHGTIQSFEISIEKPFPDRINVNLPLDLLRESSIVEYRTKGLMVDGQPSFIGISSELSESQALPIAVHEVRRYRESLVRIAQEQSADEPSANDPPALATEP